MPPDAAAASHRRNRKPSSMSGSPKPLPFAAAVVHENLERRRAEVARIGRHAGELGFGRDDEMITEVDAGARFGNGPDLLENRLERLRGHQVGNESRDAAGSGRGGLLRRVRRHARTRNVLAVSKMQMDIDDAREHRQTGDVDPLAGVCRQSLAPGLPRTCHRGWQGRPQAEMPPGSRMSPPPSTTSKCVMTSLRSLSLREAIRVTRQDAQQDG